MVQMSLATAPKANNVSHKRLRRLTCTKQSAFTLIEILLALGLTITLLVVVYAALDLYRLTTSVGRERMEQAQLARAILSKIQLDIRSVVYSADSSTSTYTGGSSGESSSGSGSGGGSSSSGTSGSGSSDETDNLTEQMVDPADAFADGATGILGDSQTLVLHVNQPTLRVKLLTESVDSPVGERLSDLQSIAYFLAVSGAEGLSGLVGDVAAAESEETSGGGSIQGLARLSGDRLAIQRADEEASLTTLATHTKLLAEEVNSLEFQYFDGTGWTDTWDSATQSSLPSAIRVIIGFRSPEEMANVSGNDRDSTTDIKKYQLTVLLPLAKPEV
jgi:Tfp pilus assembly protein PilV